MSFTIGSLFDGSGGFPLAAAMCGGIPSWASEVEPYPIAVTRSRLPAMKHLGNICKINGADVNPVYAVTFGSPCQGLSNAGLQKGLADNRSILFFEAVRVIKEMREATNGVYPRFAVWENVPGAFSSNGGEDFRIVLETLIKIVEPAAVMPPVPKKGWPYADSYCGEGWSLSYRTLDAQHWGVPQRRRRIYLVLDLGGQCARKVLFERKGLRGYFETGRSPWRGIEANAQNCDRADDCVVENESCIDPVKCYDIGEARLRSPCEYVEVAPTLSARCGTGGNNVPAVLEPICCIDGDKIGKAERSGGSGLGIRDGDKMYTLTAKDAGTHAVCVRNIVRCLTPTECARLQGFADQWGFPDPKEDFTDDEYRFWLDVRNTHAAINGKAVKDHTKSQMLKWYNKLHTDSSEYKMWGNGIALPCALYVMQGIADVFDQQERR